MSEENYLNDHLFSGFPADNNLEEIELSGVTFSSPTFFDGLPKLKKLSIGKSSTVIPFAGKHNISVHVWTCFNRVGDRGSV